MVGAGVLTAALVSSITAAHADKSQYNLLNPTPRAEMRKMNSDQTMFTLTPYTVDAGHFQLETDIVDYFYDKEGNIVTKGWVVGWGTIKIGLLDRVDLGISSRTYTDMEVENKTTGTKTTDSGFGNLTTSLKINLWGNEGDTKTALALNPYVTFPTSGLNGDDNYSTGVSVPFATEIGYGFRLGAMVGIDFDEDAAGDWDTSFTTGVSLRRDIFGDLDGYGEFIAYIPEDSSDDWSGDVNVGVAYQVNEDIEVHLGSTFGVENSTDYNPYIGLSWRL